MKPPSQHLTALVVQLDLGARTWFRRSNHICATLRAIRSLGEIVAVPELLDVLVDRDEVIAAEAAATVHSLIPERMVPELLLSLEQHVRLVTRWRRASMTPSHLHSLRLGADCSRIAGILSCHGNGYVREAAVELLDREAHSGRELPFLLLRLNDAVSAVRHVAEVAIGRRCSEVYRAAFLECLPLLARLQQRRHITVSPSLRLVEQLLTADAERLITAALASHDRPSIRAAITTLWNTATDDEARAGLAERIMANPDPGVRYEVVYRLAERGVSPDLAHRFLSMALKDRAVFIRRTALGWCAAHDSARYGDVLRTALLDRSGLVRSIAQFHLRTGDKLDLPAFYRDQLESVNERTIRAAIGGVGETGSATDARLLLPWARAGQVGLKKSAIKALALLAPAAHFELFFDALHDSHPGISRAARSALSGQETRLNAEQLLGIAGITPHVHVRSQVLSLGRFLPKWQQITFLLRMVGEQGPEISQRAIQYLREWLARYNCTHQIQPSRAEIATFGEALRVHSSRLPSDLHRELFGLLASLGF